MRDRDCGVYVRSATYTAEDRRSVCRPGSIPGSIPGSGTAAESVAQARIGVGEDAIDEGQVGGAL
ncbi:MAG TPA: hypothetical protein PK324_07870, partial [Nocardioides sp.]|nr:hypothetical protein [Nocardioides sp.]